MRVRRLSLRIAGSWEDAWLYREHLIAWATDGSVHVAKLDDVRRVVQESSGHHLRVLAEHMVLRSSWKSASERVDLLGLPGVGDAFFDPIVDVEDSVIDLDRLDFEPAEIEAVPGHITDTAIYGNRILATSDEGLFEGQIDLRGLEPSPLLQLAATPAMAIVAAGGQLAASLGGEGLVTREIEFGHGAGWVELSRQANLERVSDYSRLVTRSSFHLLTYGEESIPDIVRSTTTRRSRENGFEETIITNFAEPESLREPILIARDRDRSQSAPDQVEVLGNADYRLLVRTDAGIDLLNIRAFPSEEVSLQRAGSRQLGANSPILGTVLSTQAMRSGPLIEHLGGAHILTDSGLIEIADELAVQVRSFPNSRRYSDTAVVVRETCLDLVGFVDLDDFHPSW